MPIAPRMIRLVFCDAMTSNGFSSKPKRRYMGSSTCSKPNTLPNSVPNTMAEMPQGINILPMGIFLSFHISQPAMARQKPCPKSANMMPKIMV